MKIKDLFEDLVVVRKNMEDGYHDDAEGLLNEIISELKIIVDRENKKRKHKKQS